MDNVNATETNIIQTLTINSVLNKQDIVP